MKGNENSIEQFFSWPIAAEKIEKLLVKIEKTLINLTLSEDEVLQIEKRSLQFVWFDFLSAPNPQKTLLKEKNCNSSFSIFHKYSSTVNPHRLQLNIIFIPQLWHHSHTFRHHSIHWKAFYLLQNFVKSSIGW